jgi:histidine kinase
MTLNSREDIKNTINNIAEQPQIEYIRIYNKQGRIKFSNDPDEIDRITNIESEACIVCHRAEPPTEELALAERTRMTDSPHGSRSLAVLSPIYNEPGCASGDCHFHPEDKTVLGALDISISLSEAAAEMSSFTRRAYGATILVFLAASSVIVLIIFMFVRRPMNRLIAGTRQIADGREFQRLEVSQDDEMGELSQAINTMAQEILKKQNELNHQRDEYQNLFESVPCIITVQDRDYKILRYNREFEKIFRPEQGSYCYQAYKGRDEKCPVCPVEETFATGVPQFSEESGYNRGGERKHWLVHTSPIFDEKGNVVAAMEMCLDITQRRNLELELEKSEQKYYAIFNGIPNPVFVLDRETLNIRDCNNSATGVYGYSRDELVGRSFISLFSRSQQDQYVERVKTESLIRQARHYNKDGLPIFVSIRISPSEYANRKVLLVTTNDITKRLLAEQQLFQASKMTTMGEMATGVAHELNQPLAVIKTASNFLKRKVNRNESIEPDVLEELAEEIDQYVDRATRIIKHMREFGHKSEMILQHTDINPILQKAFDMFGQQLTLREIQVSWRLDPELPQVMSDPGRMEQAFVNLLINARDAIESQWREEPRSENKHILLKTEMVNGKVRAIVADNGTGISKGVSDKIFEPFYTSKEVGQGTGLGLSIIYTFMQDCSGRIWFENNDMGGASFILEFPPAGDEQ